MKWLSALIAPFLWHEAQGRTEAWRSFETDFTISRVRSADHGKTTRIIASSYEGTLLSYSLNGELHWKNELSGFMNRDLWCTDLDGDGQDEVLAANADGTLYCISSEGKTLWKFQPSIAPMNAVTTVQDGEKTLICCGGYDTEIHWLSATGEHLKTIPSRTYSKEEPWGKPLAKRMPPKGVHIANFLRPLRWKGKEILLVNAAISSNNGFGTYYLFEPLAEEPFLYERRARLGRPTGDLVTLDLDQNGTDEVLVGTSAMTHSGEVMHLDFETKKRRGWHINDFRKQKHIRKKMDGLGYRVSQTVPVGREPFQQFLTSFGSRFILSPKDFAPKETQFFICPYSFNDFWKVPNSDLILLGSIQSGGSCLHVLNTSVEGWSDSIENFQPKGKIKAILAETAKAREQLATFQNPEHERRPKDVFFLTESHTEEQEAAALALEKEFGSPRFLMGQHLPRVEEWDRATVTSELYQKKRDSRKRYELSQDEILSVIAKVYAAPHNGVAFWGGHGNDPYLLSTDTIKKIIARNQGEKTVLIYPELEKWDDEFAQVLADHIYPIAEAAKGNNTNIYVRTKHAFWHSIIYQPLWQRLLSGEFKDVFVPSMEETTDKTPEQTTPARLGIWASGAVDQWGSRVARDNPSFDRLRQHSHQMLPNHFLRNQIYHLSLGATYQNNFAVDQDYFSILYELVAKGALYVPDRNQIVSFNPVYLGMKQADPDFLDAGNNVKWVTFFDAEHEEKNAMVFGRLNGTWPGAPVQEWDYSAFAANVKDRRLNYLPPNENGLVLIGPAQQGTYADSDAPRGLVKDHLHPLYRDHLTEFLTDGRQYLSPDGKETFPADQYYTVVAKAIAEGAQKLPLTVKGEVAWTVAQTAPDRLRLTLIDGGYLNPNEQTATITFRASQPDKMTDLLSGETFSLTEKNTIELQVPCGLFRFFDIKLTQPFPEQK